MLVSSFGLVNPNLVDKRRQNLAGFAEKRIIGEGSERRWIFVDLNHGCAVVFRATPEIGCGINDARGADGKENVAIFGGRYCGFERISWQHFAKPNDVRSQMSAARSTSTVFDIEVVAWTITFETTEAMNVSVKLDHSFAAGAHVQAIDILSDQQKFRRAFFHFCQSQVPRVWLCLERVLTSPGVPILNEFRIALERFRGREFFRPELAPEPGLSVAKSGEPAFGRNPGAGQRDKFLCAPQLFD